MTTEPHPAIPADANKVCATSDGDEWLTFRLGEEEYGINILGVQEIRGYHPPTRIAGAADFVKGVCNLRGVIVPVVDLRLRLGVTATAPDHRTATVILNFGVHVVGVVVDAVCDVVRLAPDDIRPAPSIGSSLAGDYIRGLGGLNPDDAERLLILLDIQSLVCSKDFGLARQASTLLVGATH